LLAEIVRPNEQPIIALASKPGTGSVERGR
jgi:hypothetical protein